MLCKLHRTLLIFVSAPQLACQVKYLIFVSILRIRLKHCEKVKFSYWKAICFLTTKKRCLNCKLAIAWNSKGLFVFTEYLIFVSILGIHLKNGKSSNCILTNPLNWLTVGGDNTGDTHWHTTVEKYFICFLKSNPL